MGDRIDMSVSGDSLSDETLNRGPWRCSCGDRMNFPLGLIQCKFSFFFFNSWEKKIAKFDLNQKHNESTLTLLLLYTYTSICFSGISLNVYHFEIKYSLKCNLVVEEIPLFWNTNSFLYNLSMHFIFLFISSFDVVILPFEI